MASYFNVFKSDTDLVKLLGESNAHMIWALGLYLEEADLPALASQSLTDGSDDKKLDFIYVDRDSKRLIFAQGYFSQNHKDSAPSNKAADLNTAAAWLLSGDFHQIPQRLRPSIEECRQALAEGDVETIELIYVHNLPESVNVNRELQTAATHLQNALQKEYTAISVQPRELGTSAIENLFASQESQIKVKEEITCPAKILFTHKGPKWDASVLSVPGNWLQLLFTKYGDALFSANYRGFLGTTKRRRINTTIRQTAESQPTNFWVFNNGITVLTLGIKPGKDDLVVLTGISIINGAQTTGSLGSVDTGKHDLKQVSVLCRIIQCSDTETIGEIVRYNNTQNEITTWDQYSNDQEQTRIEEEFGQLGHTYSRKRGFHPRGDQIGIEEVAQPLVAFQGRYRDANRGKNEIFDRKALYNLAFQGKKARHILFVYTLARAVDERRISLKQKSTDGTIIGLEEKQLILLRNLRFKYFFVSVVAKVLEAVIRKKINFETIAFCPEAAKSTSKSILALVAAWGPVVDATLTFVSTQLPESDFGVKLGEEGFLESVSNQVSALIYASHASLSLDNFTKLVCDS